MGWGGRLPCSVRTGRVKLQQFAQLGVALAAIPAHFKALGQLLAGACAPVDGFADLAVGDRFANADVHRLASIVVIVVVHHPPPHRFRVGDDGPVNLNAVAFFHWQI